MCDILGKLVHLTQQEGTYGVIKRLYINSDREDDGTFGAFISGTNLH